MQLAAWRIAAAAAAIAVGSAGGVASAATVTYAGAQTSQVNPDATVTSGVRDFRETDVLKPLDADANNVLGSSAYKFWATAQTPATIQSGSVVNFDTSSTRLKSSFPASGFIASVTANQASVAYSYNYAAIDDPAAAPGAAVPDIVAGIAGRQLIGNDIEVVLFNINVTQTAANLPAAGFRVGVALAGGAGDTPASLRITDANGVGPVAVTPAVATAAGPNFYFFDVTNPSAGEVLHIRVVRSTTTVNNGRAAFISGVTFDAIPEPGSLALAALGGASLLGRRRRR